MEQQQILNPMIYRNLSDKLYEKRKLAALEIEKLVREYVGASKFDKVTALLTLISKDFSNSANAHNRNGGLIALAATGIALGPHIKEYLPLIVTPILQAFSDNDSRVRYYACESMYNVGKVAKTNILEWFNEIFDHLTKLSVDIDLTVKNGAELLDRLIKDIVSEQSLYFTQEMTSDQDHPLTSPPLKIYPPVPGTTKMVAAAHNMFNLPRFMPLLKERMQIINPAGRLFLVQWIFLLNSVPQLDLLTWLPEFMDGLFVYLSDSNSEVRAATSSVLGEFLKEIIRLNPSSIGKADSSTSMKIPDSEMNRSVDDSGGRRSVSLSISGKPSAVVALNEKQLDSSSLNEISSLAADEIQDIAATNDSSDTPKIKFGEITVILVKYLSSKGFLISLDEETQATALRWITTFIGLARTIMLPYSPMLLEAILPTLSHPVNSIRSLAIDANTNLFELVFDWSVREWVPNISEPFNIVETVVTLMRLCQDASEDTRVGALEWLLMLHKKYPSQVMSSSQSFFNGLLKTLSDYSEEVVRRDLLLLAQISYNSDDEYFNKFMVNLLNHFTIDRKLLESRGSLILRQLCSSLNPERMYRSFAEILELEEDLEFASTMIQTLNLILITAPELADMRKRLKNIETKEGAELFAKLYKSWCHNPISVFSLCLLCQAYEHAANLITGFGDLEINVQFLIQMDKLVQLLESPVFTALRLQLIEPEKNAYLYKCLYGILMLLPQSSAFATLRNRLNSVSSLSRLNEPVIQEKSTYSGLINSARRKSISTQETQANRVLKWDDFMTHFKTLQLRHETAHRIALNTTASSGYKSTGNIVKPERKGKEELRRTRSGSVPVLNTLNISRK